MPDTAPDPAVTAVVEELMERAAAGPDGSALLDGLVGRIVVVKYGGAAMSAPAAAAEWARDLVLLQRAGVQPIVVHGGGPALTSMMDRLGIASSFHEGHRVTSADAVEVAEMVLSGRVNKQVVSLLQRAGGSAVGLSGTDGGMIGVRPHRPDGADLGFVGWVDEFDTQLVCYLLDGGYIPVVSSTAADEEGQTHNINADTVTGELAGAVEAASVVFLSDVPGVMIADGLQEVLTAREAVELLAAGVATGGMRPKLEAGLAALAVGVPRVHLVDGRVEHAMLRRLVAGDPIGTTLIAEEGS
jgi:acetylglutamate kinase